MQKSVFDYVSNLDTLLAVAVGAILATFGALVAEMIQDKRNRRQREQDAARFFGDIITTLDQVLDFTLRSQSIGDRWGPLSLRLFKTALREAEVYERNRERLFDIREMKMRSRIHSHFLYESFPLDAILENSSDINELEARLERDKDLTKAQIKSMNAEISALKALRENALSALIREKEKTGPLCAKLEKIAGIEFDTGITQEDLAANAPDATSVQPK